MIELFIVIVTKDDHTIPSNDKDDETLNTLI